jgi:uncharacterized membrane protein YdjX (TVP38/TMEM64 family)
MERVLRGLRIAVLLGLVVAIVVAHRHLDLTDRSQLVALREALARSGIPGLLVFVAGLSLSILLYMPGWPFIGLAVAVHGRLVGGLISLGASIVAVCITFAIVRFVGGRPLAEAPSPRIRKLLAQLDTAPVRTVFLLRFFASMNAIVNYSLALSQVSFRHYLVGSAAGLIWPVLLQVLLLSAVIG